MRTLRRSKSCRVRKVKGKLEVFRGRDPTMCFKCHADFGHQELPAVGGLHVCALENLKIVLSRPSDIPAENVAISPRKVANAGVRALSIAITSVCGLIVLMLTCSVAALAEENPKVEVFGGFSLRETQPPPVSFPTGPFPDYLAGWHFSVAGRLNPYLLLVTEASANSED